MSGKTTKPLEILVHPDLWDLDEVQLLRDQGHRVYLLCDITAADMVIGPNCWRMPADCIKYLPAAIKAARAVVYGPTKGAKDAVVGGDTGSDTDPVEHL